MAIEWEYGLVAFLDILGFSNLVEEDAKSLVPKNLERLISFIDQANESLSGKSIDLRAFSDSIVISSRLGNDQVVEVLAAVSDFQRRLIDHGVLLRGAIALGKHYFDERAMYSEALISAYVLERDVARFPRIVVQEDLYDWFSNDRGSTESQIDSVNKMLLRDRDGRFFVNYLSSCAIERHLELINGYRTHKISSSVLEKLQWLAEYHNYVVGQNGLDLHHEGPLVAGFQAVD